MALSRTRRGWQEPRPEQCEGCGARFEPYRVLVGAAPCRCGSAHRTFTCRGCDVTKYVPALGDSCMLHNLDDR